MSWAKPRCQSGFWVETKQATGRSATNHNIFGFNFLNSRIKKWYKSVSNFLFCLDDVLLFWAHHFWPKWRSDRCSWKLGGTALRRPFRLSVARSSRTIFHGRSDCFSRNFITSYIGIVPVRKTFNKHFFQQISAHPHLHKSKCRGERMGRDTTLCLFFLRKKVGSPNTSGVMKWHLPNLG